MAKRRKVPADTDCPFCASDGHLQRVLVPMRPFVKGSRLELRCERCHYVEIPPPI